MLESVDGFVLIVNMCDNGRIMYASEGKEIYRSGTFLHNKAKVCHHWAFHSIFVTWFLVVLGNEVTKMLCNSLFTFFTEQDKTGTRGNENLATYFWYFGSFDEKRSYENM